MKEVLLLASSLICLAIFCVGFLDVVIILAKKLRLLGQYLLLNYQSWRDETVDKVFTRNRELEQQAKSLQRRIHVLERRIHWHKLYEKFVVPNYELRGSTMHLKEVEFDGQVENFFDNIRQLAELGKDVNIQSIEKIAPIVKRR